MSRIESTVMFGELLMLVSTVMVMLMSSPGTRVSPSFNQVIAGSGYPLAVQDNEMLLASSTLVLGGISSRLADTTRERQLHEL